MSKGRPLLDSHHQAVRRGLARRKELGLRVGRPPMITQAMVDRALCSVPEPLAAMDAVDLRKIAELVARRNVLLDELEHIEAQLRGIDHGAVRAEKRRRLSAGGIMDQALQILRYHGRPMHVREIHALMPGRNRESIESILSHFARQGLYVRRTQHSATYELIEGAVEITAATPRKPVASANGNGHRIDDREPSLADHARARAGGSAKDPVPTGPTSFPAPKPKRRMPSPPHGWRGDRARKVLAYFAAHPEPARAKVVAAAIGESDRMTQVHIALCGYAQRGLLRRIDEGLYAPAQKAPANP